jgi:glutamate--cysteine ligase
VQVNLDFRDEADMVRKLRTSLALQPVATALFANSPFVEGRRSGFLSTRAQMWLDTDPDRTGILPFAFEPGMGFERYADYALDVPMYFVSRDGRYIDVAGASFRDFLDGRLEALPGERPTIADWEAHLSTLFPDVRLKRYLEMRGADGGPWRRLCALPALWVGVLYDDAALEAAWDLAKGWSAEDMEQLRRDVPRLALGAEVAGRTVGEVAADFIEISRGGLKARSRADGFGDNEEHFLNAVEAVIEEGRTPAEELLEKFDGPWGGDVDRVFEEYAY